MVMNEERGSALTRDQIAAFINKHANDLTELARSQSAGDSVLLPTYGSIAR